MNTSATDSTNSGTAQSSSGISLVAFVGALVVATIAFAVQTSLFLILRTKLVRIYKPKTTFMVPERERTEPPPASPWGMMRAVMGFNDREVIKKCGLDAYFFMRYLKTLLVIFIPLAAVIIPILVPINYVGGLGQSITTNATNGTKNNVTGEDIPSGLDTLAWGNISYVHYKKRWAHLVLAVVVIFWVCLVIFTEFRVYIKVRQDWLTSAEHRLRASASTVLVSNVPDKWLSEEALRGLFDVFPGGIRNIWLTHDLTKLLDKIKQRDKVHQMLESAESDLIRECKKQQLKQRDKEEKKSRKENQVKQLTKAEKEQRQKQEDEAAQRRAEADDGMSLGDHDPVPQNIEEAVAEERDTKTNQQPSQDKDPGRSGSILAPLSNSFAKVGHGVNRVGHGIAGGVQAIGHGLNDQIETTNGFVRFEGQPRLSSSRPGTRGSDGHVVEHAAGGDAECEKPKESFASDRLRNNHVRSDSAMSNASTRQDLQTRQFGNTTRKQTNLEDMYNRAEVKFYQFWKPPSGGYASPIPQRAEGDEFPLLGKDKDEKKSLWAKIKAVIPFLGGDEDDYEYGPATNPDYEERPGAIWEKWLKAKDRPHHRLPLFDFTPGWLPGLPFINKKVDTIFWCRGELARLNLEIEEDQSHPERFPFMRSAFVQFNHQVAAHMACQSAIHHLPKRMAPRIVEISPDDVIWDNMAISWWDEWLRFILVIGIVVGMVILWAIPVAFSASLSQVDALVEKFPWLGFLRQNSNVYSLVKAVAGVIPPAILAVLLVLVPIILNFLSEFQGVKTGAQKSERVQTYYFFFLFVQVFLVVSIASSAVQVIADVAKNVQDLPEILARNLPKASNYFFSYMILQAMSVSSGTLLQVGSLAMWYIIARILDNTVRAKFRRTVSLPNVNWGSFFPVYTNFACIALIYSVIAPLISVFAIITFGLLWAAHRYSMLYVTRFKRDTGGVLYPRALNQTFVGLYVMELCLVGLFFLVTDPRGDVLCYPQAIIMVVAIILTALYQFVLNQQFGPLLRYLPITFEDEAVLRDAEFQRAQNRRLGIANDEGDAATLNTTHSEGLENDKDIELQQMRKPPQQHVNAPAGRFGMLNSLNPVKGLKQAGTWAVRSGNTVKQKTMGKTDMNVKAAAAYRRNRKAKDLEAQRAMGEALWGGLDDEIEDLTPEEREDLVRKAFRHSALRNRRPVVWIPRDDIGVSDDEIKRTNEFSEYIWISNAGTALDSKCRAVFGRGPPDLAEEDLIAL